MKITEEARKDIKKFLAEKRFPEARSLFMTLDPTQIEKAAFDARIYQTLQDEAVRTVSVFFDVEKNERN